MRYSFMRPAYKLVWDLPPEPEFLPDSDVECDEPPPTERRPELTEKWRGRMTEITEVRRVKNLEALSRG